MAAASHRNPHSLIIPVHSCSHLFTAEPAPLYNNAHGAVSLCHSRPVRGGDEIADNKRPTIKRHVTRPVTTICHPQSTRPFQCNYNTTSNSKFRPLPSHRRRLRKRRFPRRHMLPLLISLSAETPNFRIPNRQKMEAGRNEPPRLVHFHQLHFAAPPLHTDFAGIPGHLQIAAASNRMPLACSLDVDGALPVGGRGRRSAAQLLRRKWRGHLKFEIQRMN